MKRVALVLLVLSSIAVMAQGPSYPYSVALPWTASTGTVTGYNMYRAPMTGTTCGAYAKLNSSPLPLTPTLYTDQNPPQGMYCYAATALDNAVESGFSNMAQVAIPPPPPVLGAPTVAKNGNGTQDVIYAWTNPTGGLLGNTIYADDRPILKVFFPTTKVRVTSPPGKHQVFVTASAITGESGPSKQFEVTVP
jgi:hypothetical protein